MDARVPFDSPEAAAHAVWDALSTAGLPVRGKPVAFKGEKLEDDPVRIDFAPMTRPRAESAREIIADILDATDYTCRASWDGPGAFSENGNAGIDVPFMVWIS